MARTKHSSFLEGSMNDRVSAVPPADFLGQAAIDSANYEKQFAMDWKPPALQPDSEYDGGNGSEYNNVPGNRSSFMSVRSGLSSFTTGAAPKTTRRLFGKVKDKLHKATSTWSLRGDKTEDEDGDQDNENGNYDDISRLNSVTTLTNFPAPPMAPVIKHKRSESMDQATLRAYQRDKMNDRRPTGEYGDFQRDTPDAVKPNEVKVTIKNNRPAPPLRSESLGPPLPTSFDSTKRPTREEINANYKNLLASGFFGTHAIQSTRFSPPGAKTRADPAADMPSMAQRLEDDEKSHPSGHRGRAGSLSLAKQPPPGPPPKSEAPLPPVTAKNRKASLPLSVLSVLSGSETEVEQEEEDEEEPETPSSVGLPTSDTVLFNPFPPPRTSSRGAVANMGATNNMPPPPLPNKTQERPLPNSSVSFSAIAYSETRPGPDPTQTIDRPERPGLFTRAMSSADNSRPQSLEAQQLRGLKRRFSPAGIPPESQMSFYTDRSSDDYSSFLSDRSSQDYDPKATDGHGGIGVATTTQGASPKKVPSGARKFVKRLKSASRMSFRSRPVSHIGSGAENNNAGESGHGADELPRPTSRMSTSPTVKGGSRSPTPTSSSRPLTPIHANVASLKNGLVRALSERAASPSKRPVDLELRRGRSLRARTGKVSAKEAAALKAAAARDVGLRDWMIVGENVPGGVWVRLVDAG